MTTQKLIPTIQDNPTDYALLLTELERLKGAVKDAIKSLVDESPLTDARIASILSSAAVIKEIIS